MTDFTPEFIEGQIKLAEKAMYEWPSSNEENKLQVCFRNSAKVYYPDALHEIRRLQRENAEIKNALVDMVAQHCTVSDGLDSMALSANAEAMGLLEYYGLLEITNGIGRRLIGRWKEEV